MYNTKKEFDRHVQEIFRNMKDGPEKNLKCLNVARRYYSFDEYEIAKRYVSRYLNEKETAPARKLLGQCYEFLNQLDKALVEYKTSLELLPEQKDLVLKVCELVLRTESKSDLGRTRYWCDRLEKHFPHHQMVFKLKEFLIKADGSTDWNKLETLILAEIKSRPTDVTLRERILRLYLETGRDKEAYQHGIEIEKRHLFRNSLSWYQCLADVFKSYKSNEIDSLVWEVWILERYAYLTLDEHLGDENTPRRTSLNNANAAVYLFDQKLHQLSLANFPTVQHENHFYQSYLNYLRAQLTLHLATLVFKTSKSHKGSWREVTLSAIPLLEFAYSAPTPSKEAWFPHVSSIKRQMAQIWNLEAAYRKSQAGHVLIAILQHRPNQSLAKVAQHCYGNWRESLYKQLFTMRDQAYGNQTSHFVQEATLGEPPQENPTSNDLRSFDDISQKVYPNSLHHLVWLGLQKDTAVSNIDSINPTDFRCQVFEELQLCCSDLNQSTLESLDRLDCEAFLYATVLCAKSGQEDSSIWVSGKSGIRVPACITSQLCSVEQSKWWSSAYDVYKSKIQGDFGQVRPIVQRGIEVIRVLSNHGLDVRVIVHLARIFTNRAQHLLSIGETRSSEAYNNRAAFFWRKARVLLQQILNNVSIRKPHHVYFTYQGKELTNSEAHLLYDEARFFLACENMKQSDYDEALSQFDQLTSPMASYYQAQIYIKLAEKQISNVPREVITSEMRSLHIIYLTKARDALYLTSDRLRSPLVSQRQPINLTERLAKDIEDIETRLRRIKPDCFTNDMTRQDDGLTDEESVSTAPSQGGGGGDIIGNGHFGASYYTTSSTLLSPKHHEPQNRNFHSTPRYKSNTMELSHSRSEARPSPERLDAQLRQLIATNDSMNLGVQVILRQVLEEIRGLREDFSIQVTKQGDDLNRQLSNFSRQLNELSTQCADQWDLWDQRENSNRQLNDQFLRNLNELKRDLTRGRPRPTITNDGLNSNQTNSNADLPLLTSDAEDDMFVFAEEEYPDEINITAAAAAQIAPYPNFQGYAAAAVAASAYRQMTGVIGTNTVTYGAPPPLQATQNPPPAPPPQFFRGVDPTGLMYAPMGYYPAQGALPFSEGQQLPDFRAPFTQPPPALPTTAVVHPKVPVNVVITSSDTLPTSMPPTQPPLSVTIPPQHRLGTLPPHILTTQNSVSTSQPHQFQISMPSQPTLPQSSLLEHLTRPMVPLSTNNLLSNVPSPIYSAVTPDKSPFKDENKDKLKELNKSKEDIENDDEHDPHFEPIIQMPEVDLKTGEEDEEVLHESRVKLFRFTDKEWKERGVGQMKILKNINTGKIRVLMRRDQVLTICANHFISPEMELKSNTDRSFIWAANDFADEEVRVEKLFARFKTSDEAKLFKDAWDTARSTAPSPSPVKNSSTSTAVSTDTFKVSSKLTPSKLEIKQNEQTTKLGGFTFNSPPSLKTKTEIDNKPKDKVEKPSPFASFSFGTSLSGTKNTPFSDFSVKNNLLEDSAKTPKSKSDNKTLESKIENQSSESKKENIWFTSPNTNLTFGSLAGSGSGSGFKTDTNFKGFVGAGTPLFLKADKTPETKEVQIKSDTPKSKENKQEDDEFVPTTEFTPVIPLPELVEVRTGEEGQEILWQERVKLLRFDNDGKQWKERGTGKMKILHDPVSGIVRLLMRREQVYKLCCNHLLTTSIKFQPLTNTDRAWTWFAHDYSEGVLNMETLAIRFKNSDQANEFKRIVEDLQSRMENDKLISEDAKNSDKNDSNKKPIEEDSHETCTLADLYKPKQGSWECKECLIRNEESAFKCIACETPNPDKAQEILNQPSNSGLATKFTFGIPKNSNDTPLVDLFKPKQGSWECKACLVRNEESASKCIACEIPNPDKTQDISNEPSNGGLSTKFTYGIPQDLTDKPNSGLTTKFIFGIPPSENKSESATTSQSILSDSTVGSTTKYTFGVPSSDKNDSETTSTTSSTNSSLSTTFPFNSQPNSNMFSFGIYEDKSTTSNQTGKLPSLKEIFQSKLGSWDCKKCLSRNETSTNYCTSCESINHNKSPSSASHSTLQEEKKSSFSINTTSNIQNGSTSSFKFSRDTNTQGSFNFGNSSPSLSTFPGSLPEASGEDNKNVAFGNTGMHPFKFSGIRTKSPGKSPIKSPGTHGISGNEDSGSEAADEDEGDQIYFQPIITLPNVPTQTGEEEEETLYQHRAKLFRFFAGEWKERGIGEVKLLKHKETGKIRILMRRDQVLKICANHYITLEMRLDPKDDKSWIWAAQDFSEGEILQEKFAIRFKTSDIANDFKEAFLQAQSSLSDQVQEKIDDILSTSNTKSDTSRTLQSVQRVLFSANDDQEGDDIEIIYVNEVTPEEKEEARRLLLPDNFYLYKKLPPCSGCRGCRDDDEQAKPTPTTTASTSTSAMTSFTFSLSTMSGANSSSKEIDTSKTLFGMSKSPAISSSTFTFGQNYNSPSGSIFGGTPPSTTGGGSAISSPSVFGGATPKSSTSLFKTDSISSPSGSLFPSLNSNKEDVNSSPVFPMKLPETTSSIFGLNKSQGVKFGDISTINDKKENNKPFGLFAESFKNSDFDQNRSLDKEISFGKKVETTPTNQKENKPSIFVTSSSASNIINSPGPSLMGSVPPAKEEALNLTKINMDTKSFLPTETSLSFANLASGSTSEKPLFLQNTSSEFKWSGTGTPLFSKKFENFETSPTSPEAAGEHDPHFEPIVPLPDMVDVKTGEEDENKLFNSRAKLYRYEKSTKEWKERGVGDLKILHNPKLGTYRLLLRREQVHKLVLNQLINTDLDMNFKDNSDKTFCWVGHNYVDDETNLESLSVRFKNAEIALLFYDTVRDCLERLRLDPASGHIEARNNEDDDDDDDESGHDGYDGNYEEEDGDDDEDDDDEVERDGESDCEDEDVLETYVEKMATVTISGVQKPILGAISIILHSHFGISAILKQNDQEEWKFLTPFTESDQVKHIKTECKWTAKDHMQKPPIERKIIAKFSSESAAGEFAEAANNLNC